MPTITTSAVVNQPVERVFTYVTDVANHPTWQAGIKEARLVPAGPVAIGSTYVYTPDVMGQKIQSQIAVGSGGLVGRGFMEGSQAQLGYLPARQTDFIFSVLAEETGFLGVSVVLGLYLLVLWRMLETARLARDRLGAFMAAGIAGGFGFQVVYNVAMVAGLVPVKGLPLPLMSYGGSSVLSSLMAVGLVLSVRMRRFAN